MIKYEEIEVSASAPEVTQSWVKTTCPYCGVGCGVEAKVGFNNQVLIRGDQDHPANNGRLCSKGMALADTLVEDGRLLYPQVAGKRVQWDEALNKVAAGFSEVIQEHGPEAVAFYASGQILTEDYYVANKLMKGFIGSANIDTNSRLCMSSSVEGHKRAFGSDTVPGCYEDLEQADLLVLVGSNLAWCHPVIFQRIKAAKESNPEMKVVLVDPRVTATESIADIHIALNPGTDVALFNGLLAYLEKQGGIDWEYMGRHVEGGSETLQSALSEFDSLAALARKIGVREENLAAFYQLFLDTEKVVTVYSQGVNQSTRGVDKVNSIINCHLATGRIGRPGMGPFSITGQPNAMGGREVGGLATTLAAHMDIRKPAHRAIVSEFWNTDCIPDAPGLTAVELFDAVADGSIKAVWIMGTNPAVSLPDSDKVISALKGCPLVVVSDCIQSTDTSQYADILLPATGWSEKSGTVTNSERRISRQRSFLEATGDAKPDWWAICEVAKRMGYRDAFSFKDEHEIFTEHAQLSGYKNDGQRDFDISGLVKISAGDYADFTPQQWPVPSGEKYAASTQAKRFFGKGNFYTEDGKARMIPLLHLDGAQLVSEEYPLLLNTGRIRDQWHTMSRTGLSPRLSAHKNEPFLQINPEDAKLLQLKTGDLSLVESRNGTAILRIVETESQKPGQLFMPIHWTGKNSSQGKAGSLVGAFVDEISGQPEFKMTPVRVSALPVSSEAVLVSSDELELSECEYWVSQKIAGGYTYHLASERTPQQLSVLLHRKLLTTVRQSCAFEDTENQIFRFAVSETGQFNGGFVVGQRLELTDWEWLQQIFDLANRGNEIDAILKGKPDKALMGGRTLCACKQVGNREVCQAIEQQGLSTLEGLCEATSAGTGCGSCLPELENFLGGQVDQQESVLL